MNENLIKREEDKQVNLSPVLKCGNTWFYARNSAKSNATIANITAGKQNQQKSEVQKMTLF